MGRTSFWIFVCLQQYYSISVTNAHIGLTFPPARKYDLDFLDNIRTKPPCGMPKDGSKTPLLAGDTVNITWHLAYPHRGGYKLELLDHNEEHLIDLTPKDDKEEYVLGDVTAQWHSVTLPKDQTCKDCTIRLTRTAREWAKNYRFWSCADVDIVKKEEYKKTCGGHGKLDSANYCSCEKGFWGPECSYQNECDSDDDCGHGHCVDLGGSALPKQQCFCSPGYHGEKCAEKNKVTLADEKSLDLSGHKKRMLSDRFSLFYKVVPSAREENAEIEFVLIVNGTSYAALGWRSSETEQICKQWPYIDETSMRNTRETHSKPEPEAEAEAEPEGNKEKSSFAEPESEAKPKTQRKGYSQAEPEPQSEAEPITSKKGHSKAEPEAEAEPNSNRHSKAEPEPEAEAEPNSRKSHSKAEPEAEAEPKSRKGQSKAEPEPEVGVEPSHKEHSKAEPEPEKEPNPRKGHTKAEPEPSTKKGITKAEPEPESEAEPNSHKGHSKVKPEPEKEPTPRKGHTNAEPEPNNRKSLSEPEPESEAEPNSHNGQTKAESESSRKGHTVTVEPKPEKITGTKGKNHAKPEPESEPTATKKNNGNPKQEPEPEVEPEAEVGRNKHASSKSKSPEKVKAEPHVEPESYSEPESESTPARRPIIRSDSSKKSSNNMRSELEDYQPKRSQGIFRENQSLLRPVRKTARERQGLPSRYRGLVQPDSEVYTAPESEVESTTQVPPLPDVKSRLDATQIRQLKKSLYTPKGDFHSMDCTDIIIGSARGYYSRIRDYYTRDRSTPRLDSFWGGEDSITSATGWEKDGQTTLIFRRKLSVGSDPADFSLFGEMHVIWARGQEQGEYVHRPNSGLEKENATNQKFYTKDEIKYHGHGSQRGVTFINFSM